MAEFVNPTQPIPPRLAEEMNLIRKMERCSRSDLHRLMNCRKNTIGQDVNTLIQMGLMRETELQSLPRGRPSVHLEIDTDTRHVLGVAIMPGMVSCGRYNLLGQPLEMPTNLTVDDPSQILKATRRLIKQMHDNQTILTGLSIPGMLDRDHCKVLSSSTWPDGKSVSLKSLNQLTDSRLIFDNTTNALGTRWLLEHANTPLHDHLLIFLSDGILGATLLINGHPIDGCIICSNELGHTRLPLDTPRCYCGQTGCLERIFSTAYLKQLGENNKLSKAIADAPTSPKIRQITDYLTMGLANAVNFCRPSHVTIMTDLPDMDDYIDVLVEQIRDQLLREFANRIQMHKWTEPNAQPDASGAALALAQIYWCRPG